MVLPSAPAVPWFAPARPPPRAALASARSGAGSRRPGRVAPPPRRAGRPHSGRAARSGRRSMLEDVAKVRGHPDMLVVDNGPELRGRELDRWACENGVRLFFIDPGKPMQNGSIESFNGRFRKECLDQSWFTSLAEARRVIEAWRLDYKQHPPHTSLRMRTPAAFAAVRPFI